MKRYIIKGGPEKPLTAAELTKVTDTIADLQVENPEIWSGGAVQFRVETVETPTEERLAEARVLSEGLGPNVARRHLGVEEPTRPDTIDLCQNQRQREYQQRRKAA